MDDRRLAVDTLLTWSKTGLFPGRLLERSTPQSPFARELVMGVVRWHRTLSWICDHLAPRPPPRRLRMILLAGIYELLHMEGSPAFAVVNETVELSKRLTDGKCADFVNAILRRLIREREGVLAELAKQPLGIRLSHPDLLLSRWTRHYRPDRAESICHWNNDAAETIIRIDPGRTTVPAFLAQLEAAGIAARPHPGTYEHSVVLPRGKSVTDLPGYREGHFLVQDPSGELAVQMLAPQAEELVLDACAAPGGKTALIAWAMRGTGNLLATDLHQDRLARLRENMTRLGLARVRIEQADAEQAEQLTKLAARPFDAILLDVPCTNTGVIRRRPDARWRFSVKRLQALAEAQHNMLNAAATALRPGGRLVYSTCSIEPEEGAEQIGRWLGEHPDFHLRSQTQLLPGDHGADGAFAALLVRKA